jgi:hypothetical protein
MLRPIPVIPDCHGAARLAVTRTRLSPFADHHKGNGPGDLRPAWRRRIPEKDSTAPRAANAPSTIALPSFFRAILNQTLMNPCHFLDKLESGSPPPSPISLPLSFPLSRE